MVFEYRYNGSSNVANTATDTGVAFKPDASRNPTYFSGTLGQSLAFREAISALNSIVVSDLRYKPRDTTQYKEWLATQDARLLAEAAAQSGKVKERIEDIKGRLTSLERMRDKVLGPFYAARRRYWTWLYKKNINWWYVLDPVITVHPDELFFECFSQDESSYGKLSCNYNIFKTVKEFACGTTNIDYSDALYSEFQKIRNYKETSLMVDPGGFEVQTGEADAFKEIKIDVPDSWVRGFLQVSSAMTLPSYNFDLHPLDLYNICFMLRRRREKQGPRSLRFLLKPGQPVSIVFDPWNYKLACPRSVYEGKDEAEIRVWGRRRLLTLERLLPLASRFRVVLLGSGMPSFYIAELGDMHFTLGLSGWTANDWSRLGNFDLMAPRMEVDPLTHSRVFFALKETWFESAESLAQRLNLTPAQVSGSLSLYTQAGRVIYDLTNRVYRVRELTRDPLPMDKLRFANEREQAAEKLLTSRSITVRADRVPQGLHIRGQVKQEQKQFQAELMIDADERITDGKCTCNFYLHNRLHKGPCEHMIALRLAHGQPT